MPDYRHMRSGSLNIPNGSARAVPANAPRFEGPRSPPNTSHVPCKFFRQGACQAGNACPFSHDLSAAVETVCKYFAKGNCKFGPKCANIHVLPDGRRINYGKNGVTIGPGPNNLHGLDSTSPGGTANAHAQSSSALTNSLYHADHNPAYPYDERPTSQHLGRQPSLDNGIPIIDAPYSHSSSGYGSPRDDDVASRLGLALSPVGKGLSVLDAPLPASFDSNGLSNAAMYPGAPWPSSVPSKFGLESPSPSWGTAKDIRTSDAVRNLHSSAFGSEHLATPTSIGSPPGSQPANGEEYFGRRAMHSASSRFAKPRLMSASVPKTSNVDRDWDNEFAFDEENGPENYVPENLQDLLTPAEKARRGSMRGENDFSPESGAIKYGSPIGTSPGRWGPVFPRHKEEDDLSRSARGASAFGHVGSPLRNSTLVQEMDGHSGSRSSLRSGSESMSMLSQQFQRSRLDDASNGLNPLLHPASARSNVAAIGRDRHMERHVSSSSISSAGRFTTPIDEEDPAFVFSMEEEDDSSAIRRKRGSAGMSMQQAWPSYAGAVSSPKTNGAKESSPVAVNGR